jgi:sugar O-acyltransferase (sialic acid O-acetyltransferase NeuD family)
MELVIFGGPGGGAIVAESVRAAGGADRVRGFLNDMLPPGTRIAGVPVLGPFASWRTHEDAAFIAPLHKPKEMEERARRVAALAIPASRWARVVDPRAAVSPDAAIGPGVYVGPFAVVDPGVAIGAHVALWPGAQLGHDTRVADFAFVGRNTVVSGRCEIGLGAYLGAGAAVRDSCRIGAFAVVGLGAAVQRDVPDLAVAIGNPARILSRQENAQLS